MSGRRSRARSRSPDGTLVVHPVTSHRWDDLVSLFGERGACGGCWCMWWRLTSAQFDRGAPGGGRPNRDAMRAIVDGGRVPGLLAYLGERPVGWVSVGPREEFGRVERSRVLRPVDDRPAWAVVCFFVDRTARGRGVAAALLRAALGYAAEHGARIVEGYPVEAGKPAAESYTGVLSMFEGAGFREVARRGARAIMRKGVRGPPA